MFSALIMHFPPKPAQMHLAPTRGLSSLTTTALPSTGQLGDLLGRGPSCPQHGTLFLPKRRSRPAAALEVVRMTLKGSGPCANHFPTVTRGGGLGGPPVGGGGGGVPLPVLMFPSDRDNEFCPCSGDNGFGL